MVFLLRVKILVFSFSTIGILVIVGCNNTTVMTMTTVKEKVVLYMAGSGTFVIDWGNGLEIETHSLSEYKENDWNNYHKYYEFIYHYPYTSYHSITITGENITHLRCGINKLTSLDVSKNSALKYLWCSDNQLENLDISKNTALNVLYCGNNQFTSLNTSRNSVLIELDCSHNQLTSLDVRRNTMLTDFICRYNQIASLDLSKNPALLLLLCTNNQLTSLDLSKNTALELLICNNNQLTISVLNTLFNTLNSNAELKTIVINGNPGENDCDRSIATNKGWEFRDFSD